VGSLTADADLQLGPMSRINGNDSRHLLAKRSARV
jgi:hypothetical protein